MRDLHVIVSNKIATYLSRDGSIVCGNSDYQIVFTFDSEWDAYGAKTARFIWNDGYRDVVFTGDTVAVPVLSGAKQLTVGVYAGDLCTTTPAVIECQQSILCGTGTEHEEPDEDVYRQILNQYDKLENRVEELEASGGGTSGDSDGGEAAKLATISMTETADGSITMVNTFEGGGTETIVIGADENGDPASITYNGQAIPFEWVVSE